MSQEGKEAGPVGDLTPGLSFSGRNYWTSITEISTKTSTIREVRENYTRKMFQEQKGNNNTIENSNNNKVK